MNTNEKGNIGLAKVITDLTEKGYNCFLPFTDTTCIDLIVSNKKMNTLRVQVKHKKITDGTIAIRCGSVINGKTVKIDKSMIDYFMIYCPDNKEIYYLPISKFKDFNTIKLRVEKSKTNNPNINLANDYKSFSF
jgi:hypothetical protein